MTVGQAAHPIGDPARRSAIMGGRPKPDSARRILARHEQASESPL